MRYAKQLSSLFYFVFLNYLIAFFFKHDIKNKQNNENKIIPMKFSSV